MHLDRVIAAVESQPWAILPEKLRVIEAVLARRARGEELSELEIQAAKSTNRGKGAQRQADTSVGIAPIYGTITQRADWLTEWSGGTSTEQVGRWLDEMATDPNVGDIILDIDSPGGGVYGVAELADKIHDLGKKRKVIAVANSVAASAAYWLGSQATEFVVTPNGEVGSIGVYLMHVDRSEALRQTGQKVSYVSAGEKKVHGNPYEPLSDAARATLQEGVTDYYEKFVRAVARGRKVSASTVREGFGRGGMARAERAVSEGMADRVGTLEQVLGRYGLTMGDVYPTASASADPEILKRRAALDQFDAYQRDGRTPPARTPRDADADLEADLIRRRRRLGS